MNKKETSVEDLDVSGVVEVLDRWGLSEFAEFVQEKNIDGRKLLKVTEGIVKLWGPRADANKLLAFVAELKLNPGKYIAKKDAMENQTETKSKESIPPKGVASIAAIEAQYQTVNVKRIREQITATSVGVEEILKKIVPPKSFLYRNQPLKVEKDKPATSYVPMDASTEKKQKRFFRLSYEYPNFDIKNFKLTRHDTSDDRGYYSVKTNSKYYAQRTYKKPESRKYRSLSTTEELEKCPEEHFYEDLNYNDITKEQDDIKELKATQSNEKPTMVKIQELFQSFKLPFFKKTEEAEVEKRLEDANSSLSEKDGHIYENSDSVASMYDSIHVTPQENIEKKPTLPVEDYLEPVSLTKDYCDVVKRDDSILGYILSIFDNFSMRRETSETLADGSDDNEDVRKFTEGPEKRTGLADRPEKRTSLADRPEKRTSMADRPLPIPVENEPFFMDIDRSEAENLLRGQPDGSFVLRPSSQPNHAYTLTVSCSNQVHNVGVRRRPDGRLALGFARRGERSFSSVTSLLRHHKKRRLLLMAGGGVCGATTLNDTPQYYQTPTSLPLLK